MKNDIERMLEDVESEELSFDPYHVIFTNGLEVFSFISFVSDENIIMKDPMTLQFSEDPSDQRCLISPLSRYSNDQFVGVKRDHVMSFLSLDPSYLEVYKDMVKKQKSSVPVGETIH